MPAMPMTYNLIELKKWAEQSGIPFWTTPQAKNTVDGYGGRGKCRRCNTCEVCPTGARYSPDFTYKQLLDAKKITLHDNTLVRKLELDSATTRVSVAKAVKEDGTDNDVEYRAKTFVISSGYCWSSHLLLLSANSRFPSGLANSSDHVGRYMTGHLAHETRIDLNLKIYPGNERATQSDFASVLPMRVRQAVRAPRSARVGSGIRPSALARRQPKDPSRRRDHL